MRSLHAIVTGRVQGVGYRFFVQRKANTLLIEGMVRNLPDGSVEVFASGEEEDLVKLINMLKRGPMMAKVEHVEVRWDAHVEPRQGFRIER